MKTYQEVFYVDGTLQGTLNFIVITLLLKDPKIFLCSP